jgi:hypothetical protein
VFLHNCANVIWSLKGQEGLLIFVLVIFFQQKNFNHIAKVANILHLKLDESRRSSYFLTSMKSPLLDTSLISTIDLLQAFEF